MGTPTHFGCSEFASSFSPLALPSPPCQRLPKHAVRRFATWIKWMVEPLLPIVKVTSPCACCAGLHRPESSFLRLVCTLQIQSFWTVHDGILSSRQLTRNELWACCRLPIFLTGWQYAGLAPYLIHISIPIAIHLHSRCVEPIVAGHVYSNLASGQKKSFHRRISAAFPFAHPSNLTARSDSKPMSPKAQLENIVTIRATSSKRGRIVQW